ncbi:hypothetical protein EVAR_41442_1 [Eumeta japonica]|uniref:Uncharacterized protein n=1 Tax=Eumeta variegata TaxID=151549 RepID=A0A4C1W6D2_EUMVA|nr:hypothetical protein EVAR_41442_1 [Eumeta japonica]
MVSRVEQQPTSQLYVRNEGIKSDDAILPAINDDSAIENEHGKVISVRVTSSVAVERGKIKTNNLPIEKENNKEETQTVTDRNVTDELSTILISNNFEESETVSSTEIPPNLVGANIEFIKQLNARKEARGLNNFEVVHPFQLSLSSKDNNTEETTTVPQTPFVDKETTINLEFSNNVALEKSVGLTIPLENELKDINVKSSSDIRNGEKLTTVSFNIVHDAPGASNYNIQNKAYSETVRTYYQEPAKVYSEPAKVYSEPSKFYSEPAKVYSEPAKVYSEPSKIYSEPAKIYSEPSKIYSEPASLHLPSESSNHPTWNDFYSSTSSTTVDLEIERNSTSGQTNLPEQNYEIAEQISVQANGGIHGVQDPSTDNRKVGYVVEGRQYRKYRVEERTSDGFIVGEYGVVRNKDGDLRGVRYTADGEASPRLIYDALMKFLQLK